MKTKRYIYQIYGDSLVFSSRIKAHNYLCKNLGRNPDKFIPYKESLKHDGIYIYYTNGHLIVQRDIL
jgi:hypothetical protein